MEVFTMVAVIVTIGCLTSSFDTWVKHKDRTKKNSHQDAELETLRSDVARLTERVRVLERLATDEDYRLRDEFRRMA